MVRYGVIEPKVTCKHGVPRSGCCFKHLTYRNRVVKKELVGIIFLESNCLAKSFFYINDLKIYLFTVCYFDDLYDALVWYRCYKYLIIAFSTTSLSFLVFWIFLLQNHWCLLCILNRRDYL